jgi:hypothetical protein
MTPYNANATCPKCGNDDVNSQYHDGMLCGLYNSGCSANNYDKGKEHVSRHCKRCHYEWAESPVAATTLDDIGTSFTKEDALWIELGGKLRAAERRIKELEKKLKGDDFIIEECHIIRESLCDRHSDLNRWRGRRCPDCEIGELQKRIKELEAAQIESGRCPQCHRETYNGPG